MKGKMTSWGLGSGIWDLGFGGWGFRGGGGAVGFLEGGLHFQLDGGLDGAFRERGIREGLTGEAGSDLKGARSLGQGHFLELRIADGFEITLGGGAQFLGGLPFLLATIAGAARPFLGVLAVHGQLRLDLLSQEAGMEVADAVTPTKTRGPTFDGVDRLAQLVGDGGERVAGAKGEIGGERGTSPRGFTGGAGKFDRRRRRVAGGRWRVAGDRWSWWHGHIRRRFGGIGIHVYDTFLFPPAAQALIIERRSQSAATTILNNLKMAPFQIADGIGWHCGQNDEGGARVQK